MGDVSGSEMKRSAVVFLLIAAVSISAVRAHSPKTRELKAPIFVFHSDEFWLNLNHFLYVLGRAANNEKDASREAVAGAPADQERGLAKLNAADKQLWRETVAAYAATLSKKDLVFDAPLPALTNALAEAADAKSLAATRVDPQIAGTLARAARIYRKAWWPQHQEANRKWQKSIEALVRAHGETILAFITKVYQLPWPSTGFPVHISAYSNWAGAYSTDGNLLVISSLDTGTQGEYGLETVFHEGMHQWDPQVHDALVEQAKRLNKRAPPGISHALIFFTAGEAVRREFPNHIPYAEKFGVWQRGLSSLKPIVEEVWKPYLDGKGTRDEAFAAIIVRGQR